MLDEEDLGRAEELLGDYEGAEGVTGGGAGVADDVGVAEGDAEGGGGVDAGVHAGYWVGEMGGWMGWDGREGLKGEVKGVGCC